METLRAAIAGLYVQRARGDLGERAFERALAERTVELLRAVARGRLPADEPIVCEHHALLAHTRLNQSVLREPDQEAISLFATNERLVCVTSRFEAGLPPTGDARDGTEVVLVPYARIRRLRLRREVRLGEVAAGLVIACLALALHGVLAVTGTALVLLGVAGVVHGLLLPTRFFTVELEGKTPSRPIRVLGIRKKSARSLVALVRERAGAAREAARSAATEPAVEPRAEEVADDRACA
jgi:hypothetical protein